MIKNAGSGRVLDVALDSIEDGSDVILFTQTETFLVESACIIAEVWIMLITSMCIGRRNPNSNNQVGVTVAMSKPSF